MWNIRSGYVAQYCRLTDFEEVAKIVNCPLGMDKGRPSRALELTFDLNESTNQLKQAMPTYVVWYLEWGLFRQLSLTSSLTSVATLRKELNQAVVPALPIGQ